MKCAAQVEVSGAPERDICALVSYPGSSLSLTPFSSNWGRGLTHLSMKTRTVVSSCVINTDSTFKPWQSG